MTSFNVYHLNMYVHISQISMTFSIELSLYKPCALSVHTSPDVLQTEYKHTEM